MTDDDTITYARTEPDQAITETEHEALSEPQPQTSAPNAHLTATVSRPEQQ